MPRRVLSVKLSVLFSSVIIGAGIYDLSPVKVSSVKSAYEDLCGCDIGSYGNIVKVAELEQVKIVLFGHTVVFIRIAEEENKVDLVVGNS